MRYYLFIEIAIIIIVLTVCSLLFNSNEILKTKDLLGLITYIKVNSMAGFATGFSSMAIWVIWKFFSEQQMKTLSEYNQKFYTLDCLHNSTKRIHVLEEMNCSSLGFSREADERFYRFFEELEIGIERGLLNPYNVYNLFAYYALAGIYNGRLVLSDLENWTLLKRFLYRMQPLFDYYSKNTTTYITTENIDMYKQEVRTVIGKQTWSRICRGFGNLVTFVIISLAVLCTSAVANSATVTVTVDDIKYTVDTTTGEAEVAQNSTYLSNADIIIASSITYEGTDYPVTSIGKEAFYDCTRITGIITIPNSVKTICSMAFEKCKNLSGIIFGNSLISIGSSAFYGCTGLTGELLLPTSLTSIGSSAFYGCTGFTGELLLPNSLISIGSKAFYGCTGFTGELLLPTFLTSIGDYAFYNCSGFEGDLSIPNGIVEIPGAVFQGCTGLNGTLTIPASVKKLSGTAFLKDDNIYFPDGLDFQQIIIEDSEDPIELGICRGVPAMTTQAGKAAFYGMPFERVYIGRNLEYTATKDYGYSPFYGHNELTNITIGNSVSGLRGYAFYNCSNIDTITCNAIIPPKIDSPIPFSNSNYENVVLRVPSNSVQLYQEATYWKNFQNIQGFLPEATSVTLNKTAANVEVGKTVSLVATVMPEDADNTLTWTTSNASVATVSEAGVVTGVAAGSATITATTTNGLTATCTVTVSQPAESIAIEGGDVTLNVGETHMLSVKFTPENTTNKTLTFESSNSGVADVHSDGEIVAVAAGSATVTVTTANGKTATLTVTVQQPAGSISVDLAALGKWHGPETERRRKQNLGRQVHP